MSPTSPRRPWRVLAALAVVTLAAGGGAAAAAGPTSVSAAGQTATLEERVARLECQVAALTAKTNPAACATPTPVPTTTPTPAPTTTTVPPVTTSPTPPVTTTTPAAPGADVTFEAEAATGWAFAGAWELGTGERYTRAAGATATLRFTGTRVALSGVTAPHHGIATVRLDGGPAVDVDEYSATRQTRALLWTSPALANTAHTLVLTHTSRRNPAANVEATGNPFSLDRAVVSTVSAGTPPVPTPTPPATPTPTPTAPPATTTPTPPAGQPVVTRSGRQLRINGAQWKFAGLNADTWLGCWTGELGRTTDANLDRYFRELNPRSLTRIWVYRSDATSVSTLRRIVAAAERYDQYLMVTLSDANASGEQCGSLKGAGYPADGGAVLAHARALVPTFAATPAIAFWEIVNEGTTSASAAPWYATIGRDLKRMDPNTLVVGGASTCWNGTPIADCRAVNDPSWNDMVNLHEYDWNNGAVSHHAQNTEALAAAVGLPWFAGESGLCCNGGPAGLTEAQAGTYLGQEWQAYVNHPGSAGMLYWDQKWGSEYGDATVVTMGDPTWDTARTIRHAWNR